MFSRRLILLASLLVILSAILVVAYRQASTPRPASVSAKKSPVRGSGSNWPTEPAAPEAEKGQRYLRLATGTPFREAPEESSLVVLLSEPGDLLPLVEQIATWARVYGSDETGSKRWFWVPFRASEQLVILGGGREANDPDPEKKALAKGIMGSNSRIANCGPYELLSDVEDRDLLHSCDRLASALEATFIARFGVEPIGSHHEVILFFEEAVDFRTFVRQSGEGRIGYAAHASSSGGYLALYAGQQNRQRLLRTLAHELTHLVTYRAFGPDLPSWLSEGLADAIGDTASEDAIRQLEGLQGCEDEALRLHRAYRDSAAEPLGRLLTMGDPEFDSGVVSYDYEQSALLVRFLLSDASLSLGFKSFLGQLALGRAYIPDVLLDRLGLTFDELEKRFEGWLDAQVRGLSRARGRSSALGPGSSRSEESAAPAVLSRALAGACWVPFDKGRGISARLPLSKNRLSRKEGQA